MAKRELGEEQPKAVQEEKTADDAGEVRTPKKITESEYTAEELAANAEKIFNTRSECVAAALKTADVTKCSISKAKEIVKKFLTKEVK